MALPLLRRSSPHYRHHHQEAQIGSVRRLLRRRRLLLVWIRVTEGSVVTAVCSRMVLPLSPPYREVGDFLDCLTIVVFRDRTDKLRSSLAPAKFWLEVICLPCSASTPVRKANLKFDLGFFRLHHSFRLQEHSQAQNMIIHLASQLAPNLTCR